MSENPKIIYTITDEAPALATHSLLPIVERYALAAGVAIETRDISLAGRVLAIFADALEQDQMVPDALAELGELAKTPDANIIKLPNISASIPQLQACIKELQDQGYAVPDYPEEPRTDNEVATKARYDKIKGSAVNPVLREGNSDRRCAPAVKRYAQNHPHRMGTWDAASKSRVTSMPRDDFFANEQSLTLSSKTTARIELITADGSTSVLKEGLELQAGEILDATFMSVKALREFLAAEIEATQSEGLLFSLHMKATMMKVSDPIIFGHAVEVFFKDVFVKHDTTLKKLGVDFNNGLGDFIDKINKLPRTEKEAIEVDLAAVYAARPDLAMVDSDRGITNLHVPSDIIIDASMPAAIRASGKMWNKDGVQQDTNFVIPDRSYAGVYAETIEFCKQHGAFDPATMGSVPNVGLMAQKAEEYGSHDKTFEIPQEGEIRIVDAKGNILTRHIVEAGDIWRACQVKDAPIRDWVKLAVSRARATGTLAIFWLNPERAHDAQLISKVKVFLEDYQTNDLDIHILSPVEATRLSLERAKAGEDTISVTGNVLRDYLTDLFPILELGTSAKMLSIVPLMNGGGLFETGAGGSAPKHVQQFEKENHLRWDSLGEFLALGVSLEHLSAVHDNPKAAILAKTLSAATEQLLEANKSPSRKVGELDNRGSHFYLALYWAQALASQSDDEALQARFITLATELAASEDAIVDELNAVQGQAMKIGGYYRPVSDLAAAAMRPSEIFNTALATLD
ncbi:MAG: Isocitrate dehydrogenase [NADP] [Opitutia bacterium UBA7350]|nr:MAG: Isocitrate dehydrogenase [NADP] [Opitutae bacterium UBA7350]